MTNLDRLAGRSGMIIADVVQAYTDLNYTYLIPREDTALSVVTAKKIDGGATKDLRADQNWDGTLKSTDYLIAPDGYVITAFTITSGSLQCF